MFRSVYPITFSITAEDHRVLQHAWGDTSGGRFLCVASAGDTPLNLLLLDPAKVTAIDKDASQLCLAWLKAEAMRQLDVDDFHALLGVTGRPKRPLEIYNRLRLSLPYPVRSFWDSNSLTIRRGILWHSKVQVITKLVLHALRLLFGKHSIDELRDIRTAEQGALFLKRYVHTRRFHLLLRLASTRYLCRTLYSADSLRYVPRRICIAEAVISRLQTILCTHTIADNPYAFPFLFQRYPSPDVVPPYLHENMFDRLRQRIDRLTFVHSDVITHLSAAPTGSVDLCALSNVFDWLSTESRRTLFENAERVLTSVGVILSLSRTANQCFERDLPQVLQRHRGREEELLRIERTGYYEDVHLLTKAT